MRDEIRIVDRVWTNPDEIRAWALAMPFARSGNYPGARTAPLEGSASAMMRSMLENALNQSITYWPGEENTTFQLCLDGSRTWVHHDSTDWAAVLFLTPPDVYRPAEKLHGKRHGIGFFRRREDRGGLGDDSDWIFDGAGNGAPDHNENCGAESDWEPVIEVEGLYNRLVAFRSSYYHRSLLPGFGTGPADGRLTQVFFWGVR
ncbi:MAG: hypothetical protein OXP74_01935 [Acidobacteriota bacterium]|nr:hypothetical protein [Acidobacteriota bacterium]